MDGRCIMVSKLTCTFYLSHIFLVKKMKVFSHIGWHWGFFLTIFIGKKTKLCLHTGWHLGFFLTLFLGKKTKLFLHIGWHWGFVWTYFFWWKNLFSKQESFNVIFVAFMVELKNKFTEVYQNVHTCNYLMMPWPQHHFFPRVILLCLYREPEPTQKTQKAPHHRPQAPSTENPDPKRSILRPQPKKRKP